MFTYEIINPSDKYTFVATDHRVAVCSNLMLAKGKYALKCLEDPEFEMPVFEDTKDFGEWIVETFKNITIENLLIDPEYPTLKLEIADCLNSILIGDYNDREMFKQSKISWEEWHNKRITSMNDIGKYAKELSAAIIVEYEKEDKKDNTIIKGELLDE